MKSPARRNPAPGQGWGAWCRGAAKHIDVNTRILRIRTLSTRFLLERLERLQFGSGFLSIDTVSYTRNFSVTRTVNYAKDDTRVTANTTHHADEVC